MKKFILGIDDLCELTKEVMELLPNGGVIILRGDLAAGKTTFVSVYKNQLLLQHFHYNSAMVKIFFIMIFTITALSISWLLECLKN